MLKEWLAHPLTKGMDIDDARTTELRRRIIREKPFLRKIYDEWYSAIAAALPPVGGAVLELGSGGGFQDEFIRDLITSEVFHCPGIRVVLDGCQLPFRDGALRAIVMTDVLHHVPQPRRFFADAARCVGMGGAVIMIEPWTTGWSKLIYKHLHHEPFAPAAPQWEFPSSGPLSGANGAMPWIIFERDRGQFEREFPTWRVETVRPMMPFRYLVSGGVSMRNLMPSWSYGAWRGLERVLQPCARQLGMFAFIVLRRVRPVSE
jgi:SAM-dependent methyltransferase